MREAPLRRLVRTWRLLPIIIALGACSDGTAPKQPRISRALVSPALTDPEPPPLPGIGGSVTITASGSFLPDVPLRASGLTLPPNIPVHVGVTGHVTRKQTDGLKLFCSFFVDLCAQFAFFLGEDPVPPSGVPTIDSAVAFASWDGADGTRAPESGDILTGPSGSELWVGRSPYFCEYSWFLGTGPCFTLDGGYVYTVHADSGDASGLLRATVTGQTLGPAGGTVDLEAATSDGSTPEQARWYFVPDGGGVIDGGEPPIVMANGLQSPPDSAARLTIAGRVSAGTGAPATPPPLPAPAPPAAPPPPASGAVAAASWTSLDSCNDATTCHATIGVPKGTFVVTALVHGTSRAAERRVDGSGGGGGAPELQLACAPQEVERAQVVTCTASPVRAGATMVISGWQFHPDDAHPSTIQRSDISADQPTWSGKIVTSGHVKLIGTVHGRPADVTAHVGVTNRAPLLARFDPPPSTDDPDMSERPYQVSTERGLFHIGHIHADAYKIELTGNLEVVPEGPNGGLGYFTGNPYQPLWAIHINYSQLTANSEMAHLQRESSPAFEATVSCRRSDVPSWVAPTEEHEGKTMHPKSHAARYASKFNELAGPVIERMVMQDNPMQEVNDALAPVIQGADAESAKADQDFLPRLCKLTLFPAPQ